MARGRMISTTVASDPQLNRLSADAERLYLRTLPHLDRDGLIDGRPVILWAMVAPLRAELQDKAPALIDEWVSQALVIRYDGPDGPVLFFKGFRHHQVISNYSGEPASRFPAPPGWTRGEEGLIPDDEGARLTLAARFDGRSLYRRAIIEALSAEGFDVAALEKPRKKTRLELGSGDFLKTSGSYQEVLRKSSGTFQADHDHDHDVVVDHSSVFTLGYGKEGGVQRGEPGEQLAAALGELSPAELATVAIDVGGLINLPTDWTGYHATVADLAPPELIRLIGWAFFYAQRPLEDLDKIRSMPAIITAHMKKQQDPGLTGIQLSELRRLAYHCLRLQNAANGEVDL